MKKFIIFSAVFVALCLIVAFVAVRTRGEPFVRRASSLKDYGAENRGEFLENERLGFTSAASSENNPSVTIIDGKEYQVIKRSELTSKTNKREWVNYNEEIVPEVSYPLDLNLATVDELITLPSVGTTIAERIIKYREENGDFKSVEEIKNVGGIGAASFEKIKSYITV